MNPLDEYSEYTSKELDDEVSGLDKEIEDIQTKLSRLKRELKQKSELRSFLVSLAAHTAQQEKGWPRKRS